MRALAAALGCLIAATAHANYAQACVPIAYDMSDVSAESMAREMVAEAESIELMRVVSRTLAPADENNIYAEYYGEGAYYFRLESIELLNGRRRTRTLVLTGLADDWLRLQEERHGFSSPVRPPNPPLWWLRPRGFEQLQDTRMPNPADSGSVACAVPLTLEVGVTYLVFRERSGELLHPGFVSQGRPVRQLPVIERVHGGDDAWLREVQSAIALNPKRASPWDYVFELLFGEPPAAQ